MSRPSPRRAATSAVVVALLIGGTSATATPLPTVLLTPEKATVAAAPAVPGVLINEVSAASWTGQADADKDVKGWVEFYNPISTSIDLSHWGLSNESASPFRWVFPEGVTIDAGKYLTVWLSKKDRAVAGKEFHASFNLDNGDDELLLAMPNGTSAGHLVGHIVVPFVKENMTWCRMPNGDPAAEFQVCATVTFGKANSGESAPSLAEAPAITPIGGMYPGAQKVTITVPAGAEVRYTLDGSTPTVKSSLYNGPLTVSTSQSVRAIAFQSGKLPSL